MQQKLINIFFTTSKFFLQLKGSYVILYMLRRNQCQQIFFVCEGKKVYFQIHRLLISLNLKVHTYRVSFPHSIIRYFLYTLLFTLN